MNILLELIFSLFIVFLFIYLLQQLYIQLDQLLE
jgi:hypothetical protein